MSRSVVVVFRGIKFRRYPDSSQWATRTYYRPGISAKQRGVQALHQEVWKAAHGPIPPGSHIHHADHNPDNNAPDNLVLMTAEEHRAHHADDPDHYWGRTPEGRAHFEKIRPLAAEWHRSPEGREWHRKHAIEIAAKQLLKPGTCDQCGNAFVSKLPQRFCSNACKSAWRRAAGLDNVIRQCEHCGVDFETNRYSRVRYCSRAHAQQARRARP